MAAIQDTATNPEHQEQLLVLAIRWVAPLNPNPAVEHGWARFGGLTPSNTTIVVYSNY